MSYMSKSIQKQLTSSPSGTLAVTRTYHKYFQNIAQLTSWLTSCRLQELLSKRPKQAVQCPLPT